MKFWTQVATKNQPKKAMAVGLPLATVARTMLQLSMPTWTTMKKVKTKISLSRVLLTLRRKKVNLNSLKILE